MRMRTVVALTLAGAVVTVSLALAADDPVAQRRKLMQENGRIENKINQVILGKYLPDNAIAALQKLQANMTLFSTLFPVGSETGGETKARPAIWADMDGFKAEIAAFIAAAKAVEAVVPEGQERFTIAWQTVAEACHACHVKYASAN